MFSFMSQLYTLSFTGMFILDKILDRAVFTPLGTPWQWRYIVIISTVKSNIRRTLEDN